MFYYKETIARLPREELGKIGEAVGVDDKVGKLTGENIFNLLLYSILEKNELSLRTIEENYCRMFGLNTRHSSVASRLRTIPVEYFERIFSFVLQSFCNQKDQEKLLKAFSWAQQKHNFGHTIHDSYCFRFINRIQETQRNQELQVCKESFYE